MVAFHGGPTATVNLLRQNLIAAYRFGRNSTDRRPLERLRATSF